MDSQEIKNSSDDKSEQKIEKKEKPAYESYNSCHENELHSNSNSNEKENDFNSNQHDSSDSDLCKEEDISYSLSSPEINETRVQTTPSKCRKFIKPVENNLNETQKLLNESSPARNISESTDECKQNDYSDIRRKLSWNDDTSTNRSLNVEEQPSVTADNNEEVNTEFSDSPIIRDNIDEEIQQNIKTLNDESLSNNAENEDRQSMIFAYYKNTKYSVRTTNLDDDEFLEEDRYLCDKGKQPISKQYHYRRKTVSVLTESLKKYVDEAISSVATHDKKSSGTKKQHDIETTQTKSDNFNNSNKRTENHNKENINFINRTPNISPISSNSKLSKSKKDNCQTFTGQAKKLKFNNYDAEDTDEEKLQKAIWMSLENEKIEDKELSPEAPHSRTSVIVTKFGQKNFKEENISSKAEPNQDFSQESSDRDFNEATANYTPCMPNDFNSNSYSPSLPTRNYTSRITIDEETERQKLEESYKQYFFGRMLSQSTEKNCDQQSQLGMAISRSEEEKNRRKNLKLAQKIDSPSKQSCSKSFSTNEVNNKDIGSFLKKDELPNSSSMPSPVKKVNQNYNCGAEEIQNIAASIESFYISYTAQNQTKDEPIRPPEIISFPQTNGTDQDISPELIEFLLNDENRQN